MEGEISKEKLSYLERKAKYIRNQILDICARADTGQLFEGDVISEGGIS